MTRSRRPDNDTSRRGSHETPPGGGLTAAVVTTSIGAGVLCGLAEVGWSYWLPMFSGRWRAVLPGSVAGLLRFLGAAVATDVMLMVVAGLVLAGAAAALTRLPRVSRDAGWLRVMLPASASAIAMGYLYVGWAILFVLPSSDRRLLSYRLILVIGVVVLFGLSVRVGWALERRRRRGRRRVGAMTWCAGAVVILLCTAGAFARYRGSLPVPVDIAVSTTGPRPNVVLVTLDTLRVDYLGCYGHPWIRTPNVDALAADGVVFEMAVSQAPSTAPSHCSIMTSVYPFDHGAENGRPMRAGLVTLADVLRAHGYETVAFTSATTTRSISSGLGQGFERYVDSLVPWSQTFGREEFQHLILFYLVGIAQHSQIPGRVVTDRALDWLNNRSDGPFFAWLHYFDPHTPYGAPPPFQGMYRDRVQDGLPMPRARERYAEDVSYADAQFGRFIGAMKARGWYDDALIIVASDHGEAFGERHGNVVERTHGRYLYDTTQRVPLIVKPAGGRAAARRVGEQVELTDIAPTVLDLLDVETPESFVGLSLAALLDGRPFEHAGRDAHAFNIRDVAASDRPGGALGFVQQLALRSARWKYIVSPRIAGAELYDLVADPAERVNLVGERVDLADDLDARLMPFWDRDRDMSEDPRQRLAPALVRQLQSLGYLGGDAKTPPGDGPTSDGARNNPDETP